MFIVTCFFSHWYQQGVSFLVLVCMVFGVVCPLLYGVQLFISEGGKFVMSYT